MNHMMMRSIKHGTNRRGRLAWLAMLFTLLLVGSSAFAVQFADDFSTAANDGAFDATKWNGVVSSVTTPAGSVAQDGAANAMVLTTVNAPWPDCVQLAAKTLVDIASTTVTKGTNIEFTINSMNITTPSPTDARVSMNAASTFTFMLAEDTATTSASYALYSKAALGLMFHFGSDPNKIGIEGWTKGRNDFLGPQCVFHSVNVTYPLKVNLLINEKNFELKFNDVVVAGGATLMDPALFQGKAALRFILEGLNLGRGNMSFTNVSVSDVDAATLTDIPVAASGVFAIEDDFGTAAFNNSFDKSKFLQGGAVGWAAGDIKQTGGQLVMTAPAIPTSFAFDLCETGLCTAELPFISTSEAILKVDLLGTENLADFTKNTIFTTTIVSDISGDPYDRQGAAGYHNAYINNEGGPMVTFWEFGKARGVGGWGPMLGDTDLHHLQSINFPAHIELKVDATNYELKVNGTVISFGPHGATFTTGRVAAIIMARNDGGGQTKAIIDNFSFKVTPLSTTPNAAKNWSIYN